MRAFRLGMLAVTFGLGFSVYACGSDDSSTFDGGSGDDGGLGDGTLGDDTGTFGSGCSPACGAGQTCSITKKCIPTGTCAAAGDCPSGEVCDDGDGGSNTCAPGGGCGATKVAADVVPPNLLIALDRSCSMTDKIDPGDGGMVDKWTIAVGAIDRLMKDYKGKIRFGLVMFPDPALRSQSGTNRCPMATSSEQVAVGPGNEAQIKGILDASSDAKAPSYPSGPCVTNIDTAEERAGMDPGLADNTRSNFILLVTDGEQAGCGAGGANAALAAAHVLYTDGGVPTFAIGFGGSANPQFLSNMAIEGGTAQPDASFPNLFYNAANQIQLNAALDAIAKKTLGCVLVLGSKPPDPSKLYVFADGDASVPRDPGHANGWDYSPATNSVTFYGGICDGLKAGTVSDVQVIYGCATATPK
ncbi:MAG: vWA domain-containing protein [Polyangiaceae bacterium]